MHIIGGIVLLVVVVGIGFFVFSSGILTPVFDPVSDSFGLRRATSTPASNNSEYHKQVTIQFVSLGSGLNQPMILSLKGTNSSENEGITLTAWSLKTDKDVYTIPRVANLYSPSVPGVPPEDIYLRKGGTVNFYSGKNPQGNQQSIRSGLAEWQIWTGEEFLTRPHGTVILRDNRGKIVDEYKY